MVLKRQGRKRDGGKRGRDSDNESEIAKKFKEERKSRRDPEATGRKTDGENRQDEEVKQQREREAIGRQRETKRETDGGREEADTNSLGGQHWHSQRGTAGSVES